MDKYTSEIIDLITHKNKKRRKSKGNPKKAKKQIVKT